jgi:hypothetical protein
MEINKDNIMKGTSYPKATPKQKEGFERQVFIGKDKTNVEKPGFEK